MIYNLYIIVIKDIRVIDIALSKLRKTEEDRIMKFIEPHVLAVENPLNIRMYNRQEKITI